MDVDNRCSWLYNWSILCDMAGCHCPHNKLYNQSFFVIVDSDFNPLLPKQNLRKIKEKD